MLTSSIYLSIYIYIYRHIQITIQLIVNNSMIMQYVVFTILISSVEGQRGPKRGFPTLRCDAPGGGWRCDAATLWGAGGAATLRRCQLGRRRCDAATLRRCRWASDAAALLTLRCCRAGATLRRCWRCDAGAALRRCWRCDAATRDRRCDAVGAATLLALRRCWRCDASFCKSAHGVASRLDTLDVYIAHDAMPCIRERRDWTMFPSEVAS